MEDLNYGGWLHGEEADPAVVFAIYKHRHPEFFADVQYDQFEARYKYALQSGSKLRDRASLEEGWMHHAGVSTPEKKETIEESWSSTCMLLKRN